MASTPRLEAGTHTALTFAAVTSTLKEAAQTLGSFDWQGASHDELVGAVPAIESVRAALDAVTLRVAARLEATNAVHAAGWATTSDYLTAVTGGRKSSGPALVKLARRLAEMPRTASALAEGQISREKASVIAGRVASLPFHARLRHDAETELLRAAMMLDATELADTWPAVLERIDPTGALLGSEVSLERQERAAHHQRDGAFGQDSYGGAWMKVRSTVEDIAVIKETLLPLTAPVQAEPGDCGGDRRIGGTCPDHACNHDGRDSREFGARLVDALVDACRRLQAAEVLPESHGATPRLVVTTTLDQLREATGASVGGEIVDGHLLSVAAVRRLACDADVIPVVLGGASVILDAGRAQRLVSAALWMALVVRDRHCAFPGCRRHPVACDAHHVRHWADGGSTSLGNLALLCRRHHTLIHTSPWQVRISADDGRPAFLPPPVRDRPCTWVRSRPPPMAA